VDGDFCPVSEARIPVLDFGLLRSDATYDVVHVWKGHFFRLDLHIERFQRGIAKLRMTLPFDVAELEQILKQCVIRSGLDDAYVEMIMTRGMPRGGSRDPRQAVNRFIAFAIPFGWIANEEQRRRGLNLHISAIPRIDPASVDPTVKNYHWLDLVAGLFEAYDHGRENVVLIDRDGNLTEGPGFNLFAIHDGDVTTPGRGVLEGITRRTALELCAELNISTDASVLTPDDLRTADEAFITSTAGGIMPVTRIDDKPLGQGLPGPVTKAVTALYWAKHSDPTWTTPVQ
jgi:branched-chain amino acid aminotransferase